MSKKTIRLKQSELNKIITETVSRVLREGNGEREFTDVFNVLAFDIEDEETVSISAQHQDYYTVDEAIEAAIEAAKELSDEEHCIMVEVHAGKYHDEEGNYYGEPDTIYAVSNKDKAITMRARRKAGYASAEVDEYLGGKGISERVKRTLRENKGNTYRGIPGTKFIWNGEWSDPGVEYEDEYYNANDIEDFFWDEYKNECEAEDKTPSESEFDNLGVKWFTEAFDTFLWSINQ